MKIFLDTAKIDEIREIAAWGIVDGVTTNPTLMLQAGVEQQRAIKEIAALIRGPISVEVISVGAEEMVPEARSLAKLAANVVVKIPCTAEGLRAVNQLRAEGIKTNVTLVFSLTQALLAARAGADYVSPFVGRLEDRGVDAVGMVAAMSRAFRFYDFTAQIIAASIRSVTHVEQVLLAGAHIATVPAPICRKMIEHPLTDEGIKKFLADYEEARKASRD